ncbi:hypothetical protein D3C87_108260 [compost metagenome]
MKLAKYGLFVAFLLLKSSLAYAQQSKPPFSISDKLFDTTQVSTLGLSFAKGIETSTVFKPSQRDYKYNHGVVLFPFKNELYAQWQSSLKDEDAIETRIMYSKSKDGINWSKPQVLVVPNKDGLITNGGWWSNGNTLIAYVCKWLVEGKDPKQGVTMYIESADGINWSSPKSVLGKDGKPILGIIEQDVRMLPNGRILTVFHEQPGLIAKPYFTDNPNGIEGWTRSEMQNLPHKSGMSRELEPSWYHRPDGKVVMVFRDQNNSYKKLAAISSDNALSFSTPILTNFPDSRAKQSAGNLPNKIAFQVSNPSGNKTRIPLVLTLSKDGELFDKAFLLRSGDGDLQPLRYEGKYKRIGYSYPKSIVWKEHLYVSYATNKEDVEVTRVPLATLNY